MSRHAKRLTAPKAVKIPRRESKFIVKPRPGPHPQERSIALLLVVRDMLGFAKNSREAKKIIKAGKVLVDGKPRKDHKYPVGLMDIVTIPEAKVQKVVLFDRKGRLVLKDVAKKRSTTKLCRINNKTVVKGGHIQLNLHDGRNVLIRVSNPEKPAEDVYSTKDTVVIDLKKGRIVKHLRYGEGSLAYIIEGKHMGEVARIKEIRKVRSPQPNVVVLTRDGEEFETIEDYVFVIGEDKPVLPEVLK
ncbi:MAG: 30S ribosomal protein S4e [Euryarchaeota archaeon]|nr:30S ribosomal protein S4e [Euryarchaeota archaeon]